MSIQIFGKNPALEVLQTEKKIYRAFLVESTNQDLVNLLKKRNVDINFLSKHNFKKQFLGNHQGIVLEIEDYKTLSLHELLDKIDIKTNPLLIMLDGITDPHNLGAIIRSAEAGGVKGIIIPKNRSAKITGTVVKVSSGSIEHINIVEVTNLRNTLEALKEKGFWTIGTDLNADRSYKDIDVSTPLVLVIGSEGKGVSTILKNSVDYNVKIDMVGKINSLNASVSAGILIFEILRKKL